MIAYGEMSFYCDSWHFRTPDHSQFRPNPYRETNVPRHTPETLAIDPQLKHHNSELAKEERVAKATNKFDETEKCALTW